MGQQEEVFSLICFESHIVETLVFKFHSGRISGALLLDPLQPAKSVSIKTKQTSAANHHFSNGSSRFSFLEYSIIWPLFNKIQLWNDQSQHEAAHIPPQHSNPLYTDIYAPFTHSTRCCSATFTIHLGPFPPWRLKKSLFLKHIWSKETLSVMASVARSVKKLELVEGKFWSYRVHSFMDRLRAQDTLHSHSLLKQPRPLTEIWGALVKMTRRRADSFTIYSTFFCAKNPFLASFGGKKRFSNHILQQFTFWQLHTHTHMQCVSY